MEERTFSRSGALILILAAAMILTAVIGTSAVTFARYRTTLDKDALRLNMKYAFASDAVFMAAAEKQDDNIVMADPDEEGSFPKTTGLEFIGRDPESGKSVYQTNFILTNARSADEVTPYSQDASVEIFVSSGIADPTGTVIRLVSGVNTFVAYPTAVEVGSALYEAYGPGWIYRFRNPAGESVTWPLEGGVLGSIPMEITVWTDTEFPASFIVTASGAPAGE